MGLINRLVMSLAMTIEVRGDILWISDRLVRFLQREKAQRAKD
jgi:hypothetical protein